MGPAGAPHKEYEIVASETKGVPRCSAARVVGTRLWLAGEVVVIVREVDCEGCPVMVKVDVTLGRVSVDI